MSRARHIAHVIHRLDVGGLENGVINLINHIPATRFRQSIVTLAGINPEVRRRIHREDVQVVSIDKRPGKDFGAYWRMWRILQALQPDLVHTRNIGTIDMQWIARLAGVARRVHGEHGWDASDPLGQDCRALRIRRACRPTIDCYVPMSQDLARWLRTSVGVRDERIRQIYNGVDTERFQPRSAAAGTTEVVIGSVGRMDPIKNLSSLIHAFARLSPAHPGIRLVLVGDGPLRVPLRELAVSLGVGAAVSMPGKSDDVASIMRQFDIFVMPSLNEGISNTILEAMATGLPVLAGAVGGNGELVQDGITGLLYAVHSSADLDRGLSAYLNSRELRVLHGGAARERVVQNFSLQGMMRQYTELYESLLVGI